MNHKKAGTRKSAGFYIQAALWYPLLYSIAILPFSWLYLLSDILRFFIYKVFKYRLKIVRQNLANAFPGYSQIRLKEIEIGFYKHLCDMMVETIKLLVISEKNVRKRSFVSPANTVYSDYYSKNQSIIAVLGHYANWELVCQSAPFFASGRIMVVYKPLSNVFFEHFFNHIRSRTGGFTVSMANTLSEIIKHRHEVIMPVLVGDQTPSSPQSAQWLKFMGQDTPVMQGIGKISKKLGFPVVTNEVVKHSRGHYEVIPKILIDNPSNYTEDEITQMHTVWLVQIIKQRPGLWL
ncbi:MAG: lysophospholipid acyltransferase family protein, partial [Bacteroidia bacterium]|nr:lysophospholipid acyltransferase family protein [Bacteroidia bacterium]